MSRHCPMDSLSYRDCTRASTTSTACCTCDSVRNFLTVCKCARVIYISAHKNHHCVQMHHADLHFSEDVCRHDIELICIAGFSGGTDMSIRKAGLQVCNPQQDVHMLWCTSDTNLYTSQVYVTTNLAGVSRMQTHLKYALCMLTAQHLVLETHEHQIKELFHAA